MARMRERRVPDFFGRRISNDEGVVEEGSDASDVVEDYGMTTKDSDSVNLRSDSGFEVDPVQSPSYGYYNPTGYYSGQLQQGQGAGSDGQGLYRVDLPSTLRSKKGSKFSLAVTIVLSSIGVALALMILFTVGVFRWMLNNSENSTITVNGEELHGEEAAQAMESLDGFLMLFQFLPPVFILLFFVGPVILIYLGTRKS